MNDKLSSSNDQHHLTHPKYRADIDGLRAISILSVIGFHAFPNWVKGGFIGVDVFFVISGFLITTIIISSLDKDTFSFKEFYARRIKRIFPALILVMSACYALGWSQLLAGEYKQLGKHIAAGAGFVSNLVFQQEAGYFDEAAIMKPLLHLWSLGIEEQFYIVWPLLLYLGWKLRFNLLFLTIATIAISFAANVSKAYGDYGDSVQAFYSPLTRFWELLIGSMLAYLTLHKKSFLGTINQRITVLRDAQSVLGAVLIGIAALLLSRDRAFPGWWALLPAIGSYLVISAGPQAWLNRVVLSHRLFVWFGLISYPLYLWHWPLLSFPQIIGADTPTSEMRIAALLIAIALAWLTYRYIEKPIRFGNRKKTKVISLCLLMLVIGSIGYLTFKHDGYGFRLPGVISAATQIDDEWRSHQCFLGNKDDNSKFSGDCLDHDKKPLIFLWGDSHAAALYPGLKTLGESYSVGIAQFTASACPPIINLASSKNIFCKNINDSNLALIRKIRPDIVLLHASWQRSLTETNMAALYLTILELKKIGIPKIILIGPIPRWNYSLQRQILNYVKDDPFRHLPPPYMRLGLAKGTPELDQYMRTMAARFGVSYISVYEAMCNNDGCLTRVGENSYDITTFDYGHLSPQASRYLVNHISEGLLGSMVFR